MISRLGFGAMRLSQKSAGGKMVTDHEEGVRILRRAFELGVNYIDTAPYYCDTESEVVVGEVLKGWIDIYHFLRFVFTNPNISCALSGMGSLAMVEECIECGVCEEKCPQKLPIRDQLREMAQALG